MALTKEDLQAIAQLIDEKLQPINARFDTVDARLDKVDARLDKVDARLDKADARLDTLEERLERIEENTKITRTAVNTLIDWVDTAAPVVEIRYPVKQRKAE